MRFWVFFVILVIFGVITVSTSCRGQKQSPDRSEKTFLDSIKAVEKNNTTAPGKEKSKNSPTHNEAIIPKNELDHLIFVKNNEDSKDLPSPKKKNPARRGHSRVRSSMFS